MRSNESAPIWWVGVGGGGWGEREGRKKRVAEGRARRGQEVEKESKDNSMEFGKHNTLVGQGETRLHNQNPV